MAWFDYVSALGQGLEQGTQLYRATAAQRQAMARQAKLDKAAEDTLQRERDAEQRRRALEELQTFDPDNIPDEWIRANPELGRTFVTKAGGTYQLRMDPLIRERRALDMAKVKREREMEPLLAEEARLTAGETKARLAAAKAVRDPQFKQLTYEEKLPLLDRANVTNVRPYLTPAEYKRYFQDSIEHMMQQERLANERGNVLAQVNAQQSRQNPDTPLTRDQALRNARESLKINQWYLDLPIEKQREQEESLARRLRSDAWLQPGQQSPNTSGLTVPGYPGGLRNPGL